MCRAAGVDIFHGTAAIPKLPTSGTPDRAARTLEIKYTPDRAPVEGSLITLNYSHHFSAQWMALAG